MSTLVPAGDEELRAAAVARVKSRRDFGAHLLAFVLVNAALWMVWALTGAGFLWPLFPLVGWGIGLFFHFWDAYLRKPIGEAEIRREMDRMRAV